MISIIVTVPSSVTYFSHYFTGCVSRRESDNAHPIILYLFHFLTTCITSLRLLLCIVALLWIFPHSKILTSFEFSVVRHSYSCRPFLCTLGDSVYVETTIEGLTNHASRLTYQRATKLPVLFQLYLLQVMYMTFQYLAVSCIQ